MVSVHFLFESLSRFEDRSVGCCEGHRLTGCRVSTGSLITVLAGEGTEPEEGDGLTCGQRIHDGVQYGMRTRMNERRKMAIGRENSECFD